MDLIPRRNHWVRDKSGDRWWRGSIGIGISGALEKRGNGTLSILEEGSQTIPILGADLNSVFGILQQGRTWTYSKIDFSF